MANEDGKIILRMVPDATGFADRVQAETRKVNASVNVRLDADFAGFQGRLNASLRANRPTVDVDLNVNAAGLSQRINTQLAGVRPDVEVGLSADVSTFARSLEARLATIRPTVHVDLDYDRNRMEQLGSGFESLANTVGNLQNSIVSLGGTITSLTTSAGGGGGGGGGIGSMFSSALGPVGAILGMVAKLSLALMALNMVPLIASASQALGVIALMPAAIGSLGAAIGTLVLGSSGIGDAFSAASEAAQSAGVEATETAEKQRAAAETVTRAQESLSDAYDAVADAQRTSRQATEDLSTAYKDQARSLRDVNDELRDAELSTEGAAIAVARARQNLTKTKNQRASGNASDLDVREADLRVRQAESRYDEQKKSTADKRDDVGQANAKGVEGSDRVKNAKQGVVDAQRGEISATRSLRDAQYSLRDALVAQTKATQSAGSAADKYAKALAKLSPNARDFVEKVRTLTGAWKDLRMSVQDKLFDGLGDEIVSLANTYFPVLKTGLGDIATQFNGGFKGIIDWLRDTRTVGEWQNIFKNTATAVGNFLGGVKELGRGFTTLASVGSNFLPGLSKSFENSATRFANWIQKLADNGKLQKFIQDAVDKFKELWEILKDVGGIIAGLFGGSKDTGDDMLKSIGETLDKWNKFLNSDEGQAKIKEFFESVKSITSDILQIVKQISEVVGPLVNLGGKVSDAHERGSGQLDRITKQGKELKGPLGTATRPLIKAQETFEKVPVLGAGAKYAAKTVLGTGVGDWAESFGKKLGEMAGSTGQSLGRIGQSVGNFLGGIKRGFSDFWNSVISGFATFWSNVKQGFSDGVAAIRQWFSDLGTRAREVKDDIVQKWTELKDWFSNLGPSMNLSGIWDSLVVGFKEVLNGIIRMWNNLKFRTPEIKVGRVKVLASHEIVLPQVSEFKAGGGEVGRRKDGTLYGPGTGTSDSIPAMTPTGRHVAVSDGETVVIEKAGRDPANRSAMSHMNSGGSMRDWAPTERRATGGRIGAAAGFKDLDYNPAANADAWNTSWYNFFEKYAKGGDSGRDEFLGDAPRVSNIYRAHGNPPSDQWMTEHYYKPNNPDPQYKGSDDGAQPSPTVPGAPETPSPTPYVAPTTNAPASTPTGGNTEGQSRLAGTVNLPGFSARDGATNDHVFIIVHTTEGDSIEGMVSGLNSANATSGFKQMSYHTAIDPSGAEQRMLNDDDRAGAAGPTANEHGLHVALVGSAGQTWPEGTMKTLGARLKTWSDKFGIPLKKISSDELKNGDKGIAGHLDVSNAWHEVDHTDPGADFNYDVPINFANATGGKANDNPIPSGTPNNGAPIVAQSNALERAVAFAQGESGKPYQYGGVGDPSWDCSGFISGIYASLLGLDARKRMFSTESDFNALGFEQGTSNPGFMIGVHRGGGGMNSHMAGTLNGVNVESGGNGVQYGDKAVGATDPQFELQWSLPPSRWNPPGTVANPGGDQYSYNVPNNGQSENKYDYLTGGANGNNGNGGSGGNNNGSGGDSDTPTTWSGLAGSVAKTAAESAATGYVSDTLGVFGISDSPAFLAAGTKVQSWMQSQFGAKGKPNAKGAYNASLDVKYTPQAQPGTQTPVTPGTQTPVTPGTPSADLGVGKLTAASSKDDVAKAILGEARKRGYSEAQARAILADAIDESDLVVGADGGDQGIGGAWGIFQQGAQYGAERMDPNVNIKGFFDALDANDGKGGDIWEKIVGVQQHGGQYQGTSGDLWYMDQVKGHEDAANTMFDQLRGGIYDQGGWLLPGWNFNGLTTPEAALNPPQLELAKMGIDVVRSVVDRNMAIESMERSSQQQSLLASSSRQPAFSGASPRGGDVNHFHGRDWREAMEAKRVKDAQARAFDGGVLVR